ncbi:MAG: hypothetical protein N2253_00450 [Bacteroidia bacterium]|nr:hypothetical protein [Bacteroidia bacterium]
MRPTIYSVKGDNSAIILRFDGMKAKESQFRGKWTKYLLIRIPESAMKEWEQQMYGLNRALWEAVL